MGRKRGWFTRADAAVLVVAGVVFLLAAAAVSGAPQTDERILRLLREPGDPADPIGPRWFEEAARDVTALGGTAVLTLLVAAVLGFLLIARRTHAAALVFGATVGGAVLSSLLKTAYDRPRPDLVPHLSYVTSASFPSGHAMLSAVVYLTLGALLSRLVPGRWAKGYFLGVAALLALLVGASRVYLGVHYPTDVVAGWAAGVAWATACWIVARRLQRRGVVEGDAAPVEYPS
jgi:undecaprenyl-diphosphatase